MLFALAVIFTLQTAITALIVLAVGARGWDDGAITLAFSHTFADTGRIALNAASEQVEGFSSPSWFLLNALAAKFNLGFFGAVYCSQILTAVAFGLSTLFVVLLAGRLGLRFGTTLAIGVALSLFGPTLTEISNGMEMTLLSASSLALVYFLYFSRNSVLAMVAAAAFLLTRFEAAIYYAVMVIPLFFFGRTKTFVWFCLFGAAVVLLEEGVRYAIFSDVLPATIHAKSHFPYSKSGWLGVASHVISTLEFAIPVFPLLLAGGAVWVFGGRSVRAAQDFAMARRNELMALSAAVVAIELFAVVAGVNLGYLGRMEFAAFPFVFLLFGLVFDWFAAGFRPAARRVALIAALSAEVAFSWAISARTAVADIAMFVRRDPALEQPRIVTPGFFRGTGLAADHLRGLLGLKVIAFMTPDVGGVGLCCSQVRVVDLGMLTNARLAARGYAAFADVMTTERPDLIEVHSPWAKRTAIYNRSVFVKSYQPIYLDGTRLYVRNDHVQPLLASGAARWCAPRASACQGLNLAGHRYATAADPGDDRAYFSAGKVLIVGR